MPRNVLLLQGPVGPFFKKQATDLERHGHNVVKVNLNGGDWYFYRTGTVLNFREDTSVWPFWMSLRTKACRRMHGRSVSIS